MLDCEMKDCEMVIKKTTEFADSWDSSDDECDEHGSCTNGGQFQIDWLDLSFTGCCIDELVGISSLPGCRFRCVKRNLKDDLEYMSKIGIQDVFVLCTQPELLWCRVPDIVEEYKKAGMTVHEYPMEEDNVPEIKECMNMFSELQKCIANGNKALLHCVEGIGRSCLVACILLLCLDDVIPEDTVIQKLKQMRGPAAIQTVKQFNFINEFREKYRQYQATQGSPGTLSRSASR